jgi:rod shape-determining protein MreD
MIARTIVLGVLLVAAAVIETSLLPFVPLRVIELNLLLLLVLAVAINDGALPGVRVGFAAGLLIDLLVAQAPVGSAALVFTAVGGIVGTARPYLAPASVTAPLILAFLTGTIGTAAYGMMSMLLGEERITWEALASTSLRVGLFNTLLAPLVLVVVRRVVTRFPTGTPVADD